MSNCNCQHGANIPAPLYNTASTCKLDSACECGLCTVTIPVNKGTDAAGQPYAPQLGAWTNTIVVYAATGAVYIYDSNGIYTKIGGSGSGTPIPPTPTPDPDPTGPLTAGEYDALRLSATIYDGYRLTATQYDYNAKQYLTK